MIDWSYDLLNEPEKELLCRLSVFAGGWTLGVAEAVCADEVVDEFDVVDLLTSLADKSLIVTEEDDEATRYRMLETIRQYSRDRLLEGGDSGQWRSRHLDYFVELAEEAEPNLIGMHELLWINRLNTELDNLRAALSWAKENDSEKGLRLTGALYFFLSARGYLSEGRDWISTLLDEGSEVTAGVKAKVLLTLGHLVRLQGHDAEAITHYEASIALYQEASDKSDLYAAFVGKGTSARRLGDFEAGVTHSKEALRLAREANDVIGTMQALNSLGNALMHMGNDVEAKQAPGGSSFYCAEGTNQAIYVRLGQQSCPDRS
ncbi:MAG: hypothetical protein QM758_16835 [Armatimonas sp.]